MEVSEVVDLSSLGKFLAARRVSLGISQERLAEQVGVNIRMIRFFELGFPPGKNPTPGVLGKILTVLRRDDFSTLVHFLRVIHATRHTFNFPVARLPPGNRERLRELLSTLATIVAIQEVCPSARYSELSVKLLLEALDDGSSRTSDSWTELLGNPPSSPYGGRSESADVVLEMASVDS